MTDSVVDFNKEGGAGVLKSGYLGILENEITKTIIICYS